MRVGHVRNAIRVVEIVIEKCQAIGAVAVTARDGMPVERSTPTAVSAIVPFIDRPDLASHGSIAVDGTENIAGLLKLQRLIAIVQNFLTGIFPAGAVIRSGCAIVIDLLPFD